MTPNQSSHIQLVIPGEPEFVGVVRLACAGIAHRLDLDLELADDLKLVVTEACGYLLSLRAEAIEIVWELTPAQLVVTVRAPSDPQAPLPVSNGSQWKDIGLFLIHSLMDEVNELRSPPGLQMVKFLEGPADHD